MAKVRVRQCGAAVANHWSCESLKSHCLSLSTLTRFPSPPQTLNQLTALCPTHPLPSPAMSSPNSEPLSTPQSPQSPHFGSKKPRPPSVVIETLGATTIETEDGFKQINQYMLKKEIGRGAFGTVHLGVDKDTGAEYVSSSCPAAVAQSC